MSNSQFRIVATDHSGITVSNLESSLVFWRDVLGFEFSHSAHQKGEMAEQVTGVKGAEIKLAVVKTPGGHKIELLEYLAIEPREKLSMKNWTIGRNSALTRIWKRRHRGTRITSRCASRPREWSVRNRSR